MSFSPRILGVLALVTLLATPAWGLSAETWLGKRVFWKDGAMGRDGSSLEHISAGSIVQDLEGDSIQVSGVWVRKRDAMLVDEAIEYYTSGLNNKKNEAHYRLNRAAAWKFKGDLDKSLLDYDEFIRLKPKSPDGYVGRGLVWEKKEELDKAIKDYAMAIQLKPDSAPALNNRACAYNLQGKLAEAVTDASEAIRLDPKESLYYITRALALEAQGKLEQAIRDYSSVIRVDPKNAVAYHNRGLLLGMKGDLRAALEDCDQSIQLEPNNPRYFNDRGALRFAADELDDAISDFTEAIRLPGKNVPFYNQEISWRGRAMVWRKKGETAKCIRDLTEAIRLNPKNTEVYVERAGAWIDQKELARAVADYQEALRLKPDHISALNNLAWLLATSADGKIRDGKHAIECSTKACELTKWQKVGYLDTLAAAYAEAGDFENAVKWQSKVVELAPNKESKEDGEKHLELYKKKMPFHEDR
jgi:Tfp pilus assembly protein PilF